jgi:hypothetical protein
MYTNTYSLNVPLIAKRYLSAVVDCINTTHFAI